MLLLLQIALYCLLYILLVKLAVKNDGINCLFFYPKEYIDEAQKRGIADKAAVMKKGKQFILVENHERECKLATGGLPESIWETYSSFANTNGGTILLGIREHRDSFTVEGLTFIIASTKALRFSTNLASSKLALPTIPCTFPKLSVL